MQTGLTRASSNCGRDHPVAPSGPTATARRCFAWLRRLAITRPSASSAMTVSLGFFSGSVSPAMISPGFQVRPASSL